MISKSHGNAPCSFTMPRRASVPVAASTENTAMDSWPRFEQYSSLPSAESLMAAALEKSVKPSGVSLCCCIGVNLPSS